MKIVINIFNKSRQIDELKKELKKYKAISEIEKGIAKDSIDFLEKRIEAQEKIEKRYSVLCENLFTDIDRLEASLNQSNSDKNMLLALVTMYENKYKSPSNHHHHHKSNRQKPNSKTNRHKKSPRNISKSQEA